VMVMERSSGGPGRPRPCGSLEPNYNPSSVIYQIAAIARRDGDGRVILSVPGVWNLQ